jgi:nucleoside-diphosphate-sugar epimerase
VNELARLVGAATGVDLRIERREPRPGDAARSFVDLASARRALQWGPKIGLDEGLALTAGWMRSALG